MADTNDDLGIGAFSIQDTNMGMGNQELIQGLYEPETASSNPDDIAPIVTGTDSTTNAPAAKPADTKAKKDGDAGDDTGDNKDKTAQSVLQNFLEGDGDDDDDAGDDAAKAAAAAAKAKGEGDAAAGDADDTAQNTQFTALANDLLKLGVFTQEDGETPQPITTPEEFLERFTAEKKKGANEMIENFLGQFGDDYRSAFDAIYMKGVNPADYFNTYNNIVNFAEMDLAQESNQISVMRQTLKDQGFEADDIDSEIERLKSYGDLESVSTKHHKVLVKKEAQKLQDLEAKAEQDLQAKSTIRNQYIKNVQQVLEEKLKAKEFDGIPLNPKIANELQDFLLVDKWKTPSGETLSDFDRTILDLKRPENHAMKVKVALLLKIMEKDPTLSTIQKSGVTKQTNVLFGEVARQVAKGKTSGTSNASAGTQNAGAQKSWFDN